MPTSKAKFNSGKRLAASAVALAAMATAASAGGFAPHEQSTVFLGTSFAGSAAGGALSSMFWNPAALGQFNGVNSESAYSLILPDTEITATGGFLPTAFPAASTSSGDIGDTAVLPASYFSYQLSNDIILGLSVNAPFGLTTDSKFDWVGSQLARESKIATYNFAPTVAYRVAPGVIVGAGLQIEYIDAQLRAAAGAPNGPTAAIKGDDTALGFTAGILLTPAAGTSIGLGFRSKIEHELEGTFHIAGVYPTQPVGADIELPEIVTLSLRQELSPTWTLLGSVEWTNWSRLEALVVECDVGNCVPNPPGPNVPGVVLPLGWEDGWFFSAGVEHQYNPLLTLRAGVAYEKSPIQDDEGRTVRVPDADRVWLSAGASYKYSEWTTVDVGYAHVFVEDAETVQGVGAGPGGSTLLVGDVDSSADILSVGVRSKLDWLFTSAN